MPLTPYRTVLRLPGMRMFMLIALFSRIPTTMAAAALTLSVVLDRHLGYATAGAVSAAFTLGIAAGSPLLGRMVDRRGPRPVLLVTGLAAVSFWSCAPALPLDALFPACFAAGLFQVPVMALTRQSLAARVPEEHRRQAYSLDSMAVEFSYMVGPALPVVLITQLGDATSTLRAVGLATAGAAAVLYAYDPRVKAKLPDSDRDPAADPVKPNWLAPAFLLILLVGLSTCLVLAGTDVSIVATMRSQGQTQWAAPVLAVWSAASVVGGFAHGAKTRPLNMVTLMFLLGAATIPAGLAHSWWLLSLALVPAGLACAPTLSVAVSAVSTAIPEAARGQALGLSTAAFTLGNAMGAPLAGFVIDRSSPAFGFAAVGAVGATVALVAGSTRAVRSRRTGADHVRADHLGSDDHSPSGRQPVLLCNPLGEEPFSG
jgi:MFS family permease